MNRILVFIVLFFTSTICYCQGQKGFQILLSTDNDCIGINNKDDNYTGGVKLEVLIPGIKSKWLPFYKFKDSTVINVSRFAIAGLAFTPQNLATDSIVFHERPYASLMYFTFGNTSYNIKKRKIFQSEILFGLLGASGPGNLQAYMHEHRWLYTTRPVPRGWNNQIGYHGSFVVNYNSKLQGYLTESKKNFKGFKWYQMNWVAKADAGNYMIDVQAGVKLNLFNLNSGILQDYNADIPALAVEPVKVISRRKRFRFNLFLEPSVMIVGYNSTLQGILFDDKSVYRINHSDIKRILFQVNSGFNIHLNDNLYLKYALYGISNEFRGGTGFHWWGGITLGLSPGKWNHN